MNITGMNLIAGQWQGDKSQSFTAINPLTNQPIEHTFANASQQDIEQAIDAANSAFQRYRQTPVAVRAKFLRSIGAQILALGDDLINAANQETGLPIARLQGERGRTVNQLNLFADLIETQEYPVAIDTALPEREPLPRADSRLGYLPLGVVAVFGASNFPLAFSTAGGDTASALAAGCPVVMKAHGAHPATAELVASAILKAIEVCQLDSGVFSLIQGTKYDISEMIVRHEKIKAVGFTGSERVGMLLKSYIDQRAEPIPFYGELGSVNPQFLLPQKVAEQPTELAQGLVDSLVMGQGQFCTSPGLWVLIEDENYAAFEQAVANAVSSKPAGVMLTPKIAQGYRHGTESWLATEGVKLIAQGQAAKSDEVNFCQAAVFSCDLTTFDQSPVLQEELFGAAALVVRCKGMAELQQFITTIKGNLTASIHASSDDLPMAQTLAPDIAQKVGRLIYNQMPTGVEVCASMNHGGPFPASTEVRTTSVGSQAIVRFQRPICYQNMPQELLPSLLIS